MQIINKSDGVILAEFDSMEPGCGASIGETLTVGGDLCDFRVVDVRRNFVRHSVSDSVIFTVDVSVFVIPISESAERLPHED